MAPPRADTTIVVIGWLTRITIAVAIFGVFAFDAITLGAAHLGARDDANNAAGAAANSWANDERQLGVAAAYQAALKAAEDTLPGSEALVPNSMNILTNGSVTLQIHRSTRTLVAHDLGFLKHLTSFDSSGSASQPTP